MINIEPIINPWVFYWIDLCELVKVVAGVIALAFTGAMWSTYVEIKSYNTKEENAVWVYRTKCFGIAAVIFTLIALLVPSTNTAYKMLVASYVTPDNINSTVQFTQEAFKTLMDGIVETAQRLQGL